MAPGVFDNAYVAQQLAALGLLQTTKVLRLGMPTRITLSAFAALAEHLPAELREVFASKPPGSLVGALLWAYRVPASDCKVRNANPVAPFCSPRLSCRSGGRESSSKRGS